MRPGLQEIWNLVRRGDQPGELIQRMRAEKQCPNAQETQEEREKDQLGSFFLKGPPENPLLGGEQSKETKTGFLGGLIPNLGMGWLVV